MRALEETVAPLPILRTSNETASDGSIGFSLWWSSGCHEQWWLEVGLIIASFLFLVFLLSQTKKSFPKLLHGRSHVMIAYYSILWIVAVLNFLWCLLQAWECNAGKEVAWNLLSLFTTSGMLFLEVSLLAFLLRGNRLSGLDSLTRILIISGFIVCADIFLKATYIFGFGVPLFVDTKENSSSHKWGLWAFHKLLLTLVYALVFAMYHTKWRDRLPARPAFYKYTTAMLLVNGMALFACALMGSGYGIGLWFCSLVIYHAFYLPLTYLTFLADFFLEEDLHLENAYYSEMMDAGFFDSDWE
ncbi:Transmembrane adipocyte-associated 1-like protein [Nymphaea thermarum]|nr:Transmembrane adipocyte-associated 1-like protein [Nymphaea thermarum]